MQHALFIGQYARVAVAIPLNFCLQSEEVKRMRKCRLMMVLLTEVLIAVFCTTQICLQISNDTGYSYSWLCFSVPNVILAIAFGVAYWRLTSLNEQVGGIFCDAKLMGLHYVVFLIGAGLDFCLTALQISYKSRADFSTKLDDIQPRETAMEVGRLSISIDLVTSTQTIVWFFYQCIMLKVFVKYGRPVQEDTMQLLKQKLEQIYKLEQTPDRKS